MSNSVDHPDHYGGKDNPYEVIKVLRAWFGLDIPFNLGNVIKYVARAGKKDSTKELEDLKKARWYLDDQIKELEKKELLSHESYTIVQGPVPLAVPKPTVPNVRPSHTGTPHFDP